MVHGQSFFIKVKTKYPQRALVILGALFVFLFLRAAHRRQMLENITIEGWSPNTLRDASMYVSPNQSTTLLLPDKFCVNSIKLLIIVTSAPNNKDIRQAIRDTWGSPNYISNYQIEVYFLVGVISDPNVQAQLEHEFLLHDDLVQEQFNDSYYNLAVKSVMMLKLVQSRCHGKIKYLLKTDDDMYVNIPPLMMSLEKNGGSNLLMGYRYDQPFPIRDAYNKWYTPYYLYSKKYFPNFLSGTAYVMSADVASKLYLAALTTPLLHLEDVYITGLLAEKIGTEVKHNDGFTQYKRKFNPCVFLHAITSHGHSEKEIREMHSLLMETDLKSACDQKSFINWFI